MALPASPFKFTYGSQAVGGDSAAFHVNGAHRTGKHHDRFFFEFVVSVEGSSRSDFQNQCDTLEAAFRKRDQDLVVDLDNVDDPGGASAWTYTAGEDLLNVESTIDKVGDDDTDHGLTRDYAVRIEAEMPSLDTLAISGVAYLTGLRDIEYAVEYAAGQQKTVTVNAVYTATPATTSPARGAKTARANAEDTSTGGSGTGLDQEWTAYSTARFSGDTFELIGKSDREDRTNSTFVVNRVYRELLANQTAGTLDATNIRDHDFVFREVVNQPGDFLKDVNRLRTVSGRYSCFVDIEQGAVLQDVYTDEVEPHIIALFQSQFSPKTFAMMSREVNYDQTRQRFEANVTFQYHKGGGQDVVQISSSVRIRTVPGHEFIAMHEADPYAMEVAEGHAVRLRTTTVVTQIIGDEKPDNSSGGSGSGGKHGKGTGGRMPSGPGYGGLRSSGGGGFFSGGSGGRMFGLGGAGGGARPGGLGGGNSGRIIIARDKLQKAFDDFGNGGGGGNAGWVFVEGDAQVESFWIGLTEHNRMLVTQTAEVSTERWVRAPRGRA